MRLKAYVLVAVSLIYLAWECTSGIPASETITARILQDHVAFLSSDALEGRLTGSKGEKLATQYAAAFFQQQGLEPAGDNGTYFQEFDFTAGISLGTRNSFAITNESGAIRNLILGKEWRPLSFSDNQSFTTSELVFAGYGITAPALGNLRAYDSYHGLNVKNKWVVVFRYTPEKISNEQNRQLSQYSSLRYKAFTAKENGAKGIIFVSGPNAKVKNELIPLSFDTSLSGSGIVAISVVDSVINDILRNTAHPFLSLKQWQDKLDAGQVGDALLVSDSTISGQVDIKQNKQHGRNVLARLRLGNDSTPMLIVGAHVDHLGRGELSGSRSRENEGKLIHNGADDNASGVATVLAAATMLSNMQTRGSLHGSKNILFAIWSGEELGLLGSAHFIKDFMEKIGSKSLRPAIDADINLDMVGRLRTNLVLQGTGSSSVWERLIKQVNRQRTMPYIMQNDPYLPTDSTSFYLRGVPTLNFFTGSHDEYHTPRDKSETLNYAGMKGISIFLVDLILALETQPELDYQHVQKTDDHPGRGFRVYLGTIPDYASPDIFGVNKDSPAELAGLKQDDVIVELAGKKIHDIYDYTFVLSGLHVGEPVALVVLRDRARVALTIVARSRE
jgi:hypothetical protein